MDQTIFKEMTPIEQVVDRAFGAVAIATVKMNGYGWLDSLISSPEFEAAKKDLLQKQKEFWVLVQSTPAHLAALIVMADLLKEECSGREALKAMAALGMNLKNLPTQNSASHA